MKTMLTLTGSMVVFAIFALSSCAVQEGMGPSAVGPAARAPDAKVKPVKAAGDVGMLDTEKNYMILVTKEGKLITVDFDENTKVTKYVPQRTKISEVGLGTTGNITYQPKRVEIESIEFKVKPKKGE